MMNGNKWILWWIVSLLSLTILSCKKENEDLLDSGPLPTLKIKTAPSKKQVKKKEVPSYHYPYFQERDPFVSLTGSGHGKGSLGQDPQRIIENFSQLDLKGIVRDSRGTLALISSREGERFTLKSGKIYDKRNHGMHGVSGIIKENSIVLFGPNNSVKELNLTRH